MSARFGSCSKEGAEKSDRVWYESFHWFPSVILRIVPFPVDKESVSSEMILETFVEPMVGDMIDFVFYITVRCDF